EFAVVVAFPEGPGVFFPVDDDRVPAARTFGPDGAGGVAKVGPADVRLMHRGAPRRERWPCRTRRAPRRASDPERRSRRLGLAGRSPAAPRPAPDPLTARSS